MDAKEQSSLNRGRPCQQGHRDLLNIGVEPAINRAINGPRVARETPWPPPQSAPDVVSFRRDRAPPS